MMERVRAQLGVHRAVINDVDLPAGFAEVLPRHRTVMAVEAAQFHEVRLRRHPDDYLSWIRDLLEEGIRCPAPEYARCKEHQRDLKFAMDQFLVGCDDGSSTSALLTPATTGPAPDASTTGNPAFNSPWSYLGLPTISIPTGDFADGLPLAIQLVGRAREEDKLLIVAAWCEKALGVGPLTPPLPR
jgi:aspartyl-tRNA(Asn)/glutamyl-tRNA(Gln) amidotransferase subunit A